MRSGRSSAAARLTDDLTAGHDVADIYICRGEMGVSRIKIDGFIAVGAWHIEVLNHDVHAEAARSCYDFHDLTIRDGVDGRAGRRADIDGRMAALIFFAARLITAHVRHGVSHELVGEIFVGFPIQICDHHTKSRWIVIRQRKHFFEWNLCGEQSRASADVRPVGDRGDWQTCAIEGRRLSEVQNRRHKLIRRAAENTNDQSDDDSDCEAFEKVFMFVPVVLHFFVLKFVLIFKSLYFSTLRT